MSFTDGQLFGTVIGAAVGFLVPPIGLMLGASIGMTIGGIIDPPTGPTNKQEGARLGDLNAQTSEWGLTIPRLFGTYKMAGNVIWQLPLHETKHVEESGEGKGGGGTKTESTWYSYAGSWAVAFCEGEVSGINKIWFGSVLVYDGTNYAGGLSYDNHNIYLGTADQNIDWLIESDEPDTPAYRHVCYIVFNTIELENYGNALPKVSCEIVKFGESDSLELSPLETKYHWQYNSAIAKVSDNIVHTVAADYNIAYTVGSKRYQTHIGNAVLESSDLIPFTPQNCVSSNCTTEATGLVAGYPGVNRGIYFTSSFAGGRFLYLFDKDHTCCGGETPLIQIPCQPDIALLSIQYVDDNIALWYYNHPAANSHFIRNFDDGSYVELRDTQYVNASMNYYNGICYVISGSLNQIEITKYSSNLVEIDHVLIDNPDSHIEMDECVVFIDVHGYHIFANAKYLHIDNYYKPSGLVQLTRNVFTSQGWNDKYYYSDGVFYQLSGGGSDYPTDQLTVPIYRTQVNSLSLDSVTVGSITNELLLRAGFDQSVIDTSEGTDLVNGYVIGEHMDTRSAVTSVMSAYKYDLVEYDFKIRMRKRGSTPSITDISDVINFVELERFQTVELSRGISIMYANKDKNYDAGIQTSTRSDANTENIKVYQYAIALSDDEGKQISEQYLYSEWNERTKFHFSITNNYLSLNPADTITLNYEGAQYEIRLTKISFATNSTVICEGFLEDQTVYFSDSTGSDTGSSDNEVILTGPTRFELLDIPMLDNSVDYEGIYIAANGYLEGWKGCAIHKSIDNETTYAKSNNTINGSIIGETTTVLGAGVTTTMDLDNNVTINVYVGDLYSITLEELFNANNYVCIGSEILQYQTVTIDQDGYFIISNLLRGRRGTEWAVDSHAEGEPFVFLDANLMFDSTASLNVETYYKATTLGQFVDDSASKNITPEIICKKPLSPSMLTGTRDVNNDLTITWMRRSRDVSGYFSTLQLFEDTEKYEIEIVDADVETYYESTVESFIYTDEQQSLDNSSHNSGDPVRVIVYQISGIVGRGYGTEGTL